ELISIITEAVSEAAISTENVEQVVLLAKKQEIRDQLAIALSSGKDDEELHDEYRKLMLATSLEQVLQSAADITERIDVRAWAELKRNRTDVLKVYPESLNNKLDGGAAGGDHIVVFARPEA